jgi:hypothetical protein
MTDKRKPKSKSYGRKSRSHQKGGSPASNLVMEAIAEAPHIMNYHVGQCGGSQASDMVISNLNSKAKTLGYSDGMTVSGNINSINNYQPVGGSRRRRSRKGKKSRKSKTRKSKKHGGKSHKSLKKRKSGSRRSMRGGGSDWWSTQMSYGNINAANQDASAFTSTKIPSQHDLMNPSTRDLAGSGAPMGSLEGAGVTQVGAPLV